MSLARPVEIELKYRVADGEVGDRILGDDRLGELKALGAVREAHHQDRYFDTETRALESAGYAARLRETDDGTLVTVKSLPTASGAMHRREELEAPATADLDPGLWPPSDARDLVLDLAGGAQLVELVRIRQTRRRRDFGDPETTVEVSLDDVEVVRGDSVVDQFRELEVELASGPEAGLEGLAGLLAGLPGLTASRASKLGVALAAIASAGSAPVVPVAAEPTQRVQLPRNPGVTAEDSLADAGRKVLRFHLARMVAREKGTRSGKDPEDLHAMRVATRRMRAAWRVFGEAYRPKRTRRIQRSLKEIAAHLGAVRDLDVLIDGGEGYAGGLAAPERAALEPLFDGWRRQRDADRDVLVSELDGEAYRRLVEDLGAFVEERTEARSIDARLPHLVRDTAPALIWSAYHAVRAYEPVLRWADIETLHALRIDAKRLRYSLEFFRETLGPEAGDLIERTVALQDHLGLLHDADVAAHLAREFLVDRATDLKPGELAAIGRYLLHCEHEVRRLSRAVGRPWRSVQGITFRRRLGRVLAGL
jgi:triphosphatase